MVYGSPWAQHGHLGGSSSLVINFLSEDMCVCVCLRVWFLAFSSSLAILASRALFCTSSLLLLSEMKTYEDTPWRVQQCGCGSAIKNLEVKCTPISFAPHLAVHTHIQTHTCTQTHSQRGQMYNARAGYINQMAMVGMKQLTSKSSVCLCVCERVLYPLFQ